MDDIARYNQARWEELAESSVEFSRPLLGLDAAAARNLLDPHTLMGDVQNKNVLCLASGGGQQSVAFALLGANVTVFDLSETQLQRDREAAAHYGVEINTVQGDMRDLRHFPDAHFDVIWHAYSINFVPAVTAVFQEAARVIRSGGRYRLECANPFVAGLSEEDWNGAGYPLTRPYVDGTEIIFDDPYWTFENEQGQPMRVKGPHEFRHSLSGIVNGLVAQGFVLLGIWEELSGVPEAEPGTWEHFKSIAPPWLTFWATYRPDAYQQQDRST